MRDSEDPAVSTDPEEFPFWLFRQSRKVHRYHDDTSTYFYEPYFSMTQLNHTTLFWHEEIFLYAERQPVLRMSCVRDSNTKATICDKL